MHKMGQAEVLQFLQQERKKHDNWFKTCEIQEELANNGISQGVLKRVARDINKLAIFGIIEFRGVGLWNHHKVFRAKKS